MNKKAKRRAFFVCVVIFVMYVMVGFGLPDKMSMKRIADSGEANPKDMNIAVPKTRLRPGLTPAEAATTATSQMPAAVAPLSGPAPETHVLSAPKKEPPPVIQAVRHTAPVVFIKGGTAAEPSLFISIPIVCHAMKEGLIDKEGLISTKKDGYNNLNWKKPLDILKDRDEEGLISISKTIGKKQILGFLKKEGITHLQDDSAEDIILGRGYVVEKTKLLDLYNRHVTADYQRLFPFFLDGVGIAKGGAVFEFVPVRDEARMRTDKEGQQWVMPNLANLTVRQAIEKLLPKTSKIKVVGSGVITDQYPKPFQKTSGDAECIIYGRTFKP